jgi:hypothetical protein
MESLPVDEGENVRESQDIRNQENQEYKEGGADHRAHAITPGGQGLDMARHGLDFSMGHRVESFFRFADIHTLADHDLLHIPALEKGFYPGPGRLRISAVQQFGGGNHGGMRRLQRQAEEHAGKDKQNSQIPEKAAMYHSFLSLTGNELTGKGPGAGIVPGPGNLRQRPVQ